MSMIGGRFGRRPHFPGSVGQLVANRIGLALRRILRKLAQRREVIGDFELSLIVRCGSMRVERVEASLRLFAAEVLPELKRW
jgi:hypothetical protein